MTYQASTGQLALGQHVFEQAAKPALAARSFPNWRVTPEDILKSFNTRAFKREQPHAPDLMIAIIAEAQARNEPVPFVMYWGKGMRPVLAAPEHTCLDYLAAMMDRVAKKYHAGARVTLVFTDTHAALNGHSPDSIRSYFEDLTRAARQRGFHTCLLSALMAAADYISGSAIEPPPPTPEMLAELRQSAAKWFRGDGTADDGAIRYYQANMTERMVMDRAFRGSIFVTFNGSQLQSLFPPELPVFYMYSLRHGVSDKPWFLPPYVGEEPAAVERAAIAQAV